jgi:hypothetical protein
VPGSANSHSDFLDLVEDVDVANDIHLTDNVDKEEKGPCGSRKTSSSPQSLLIFSMSSSILSTTFSICEGSPAVTI